MGLEVYLVGGAVRDGLLGIAVYDRDWVVVGATPEEMLADGFQQVGKDFPVFLHPTTREEYALARTERKAGVGYHGFEVFADPSVTLEEDLIRRDLTINAMAQSPSGDIFDPYGGQQDLENKILRHVSEAFEEDPLRVLRVARFAAKLAPFDFKLAPETQLLMTQMVAGGELTDLTPERVWQEVVKALNTKSPSLFFAVLDSVGAVAVLFPELFALHSVTQPKKYHPEGDAWIHTMMVLDAAARLSNDPMVRFSALVHDLGKAITPEELWPKHHGHEKAGVPIVAELCERYRVPKKWQKQALRVTEWHGLIHQGLNRTESGTLLPYLKPVTYLKVIKGCGALKDAIGFEKVLLACKADAQGRLGFESVDYPQAVFWMEVLEVVNQVDNQKILQQGFKGAEIAEAIDNERERLIAEFIQAYGSI
ncbi:MAG: multifunctional CCA addition/repair protein [Thiomicrorhabdus sp.]|nr:multifunctional CCA addition/repair protein [Thiomicrorhabdus sp.]